MKKFIVCGLVVAVSAVFGSALVAGTPALDSVAEIQGNDYMSVGYREVPVWHSNRRQVDATVGLQARGIEGRPSHYRSFVQLRCQVLDADSVWRPHRCSGNFGQRLVRDQTTVTESWSELKSGDDGVITSVGDWRPVTCRGLYTAELVAYQVGVAGEVHTVEGAGYFPSNGDWADC
ncbi:MAG TPA: hypothetical protein VK020_11290 [Microlunatus sp.]|nr:hypothetical protein [Microlunatus sp.]